MDRFRLEVGDDGIGRREVYGMVFLGGTDFDAGFVVGWFLLCCLWGVGEDVPVSVNQGLCLGSVVGVCWWGFFAFINISNNSRGAPLGM